MKKVIITLLSVATIGTVLFTSCKKKNDEATPETVAEQVTSSSDESLYSDASNEVLNSINDGLVTQGTSRLGENSCVEYKTSVKADTFIYTFTNYNQASTLKRTGVVKAYLVNTLNRWYDKDAQWKVDFGAGLTLTRVADGRTLKLTGIKTITNVTGGKISDLTGTNVVTHKVTGNMNLLFDNETTTRTWTISRTRTIAKDGNYYQITVTGDAANNNISENGKNRFGNDFNTTIDKPLVVKYCDTRYKIVDGIVTHHPSTGKTFTVTYGVDKNGETVSTPCDAAGVKINYVNLRNETVSVIRLIN